MMVLKGNSTNFQIRFTDLSKCQFGLKTASFKMKNKIWGQKEVSLPDLSRPLLTSAMTLKPSQSLIYCLILNLFLDLFSDEAS